LRQVGLPVKGSNMPRAQRARKDWCIRIQSPLDLPLGNCHRI
jgi:hypothetical protein